MKQLRILLLLLCCVHAGQLRPFLKPSPAKTVRMVVFIHGIMSIKPYLSFMTLFRLMRDKVANTHYAEAVEHLRKDSFFYQNQPMQAFGLQPIDMTTTQRGAAPTAYAHLYDRMSAKTTHHCKDSHYYTFGWTGLLSSKARYAESKKMYDDLKAEKKHLLQENPGANVEIHLFAYSHGGNIALNLAAVHNNEEWFRDFKIDRLSLIGVPIQKETDYLVADPLFKKVYHFYSLGDRIQKMDFFSFKRFLSRRRFNSKDRLIIPQKLHQVRFKISSKIPSRKWSWGRKKKKEEETNMKKVVYYPGHSELWFFGWTPSYFRNEFPFNPLPIALFTPLIIDAIEANPDIHHNVVVNIQADKSTIRLRNRGTRKKKCTHPFVTPEELKEMQRYALSFEPESYTQKDYNDHVDHAIKHVNLRRKREKKLKRKQEKEQLGLLA